MILGFCGSLNDILALLGCYEAWIGSWLLMLPDNLSNPTFKGQAAQGCPETLVTSYQCMLHNIPEEQRS
jgi:hypothetical protein